MRREGEGEGKGGTRRWIKFSGKPRTLHEEAGEASELCNRAIGIGPKCTISWPCQSRQSSRIQRQCRVQEDRRRRTLGRVERVGNWVIQRTLVATQRLTRQRSNSCCEDCATRTPPRDNDRGYVDIVAYVVASIFSIISVANSVEISLPLRRDTTIVIILV